MAITLEETSRRPAGFVANGYSADWTGCEVLKAAPGAGFAIVVEKIYLNSAGAEVFSVGEGEAAGAVSTVMIGPSTLNAGRIHNYDFGDGWQLAENTLLAMDLATAGAATALVVGRVVDV